MTKPRKRKPGRPRGTTRGGSHVVSIRVNDAQHAELTADGPTAPAALKRRAFQGPDGASEPNCAACGDSRAKHTPECSDCGCWGFFRVGAKRCYNPRCEGTACASETANHGHGPNDLGDGASETKGQP